MTRDNVENVFRQKKQFRA